MYKASKAVALASKTGEPLPHVGFLRDLYAKGTEIYRGSLVMIAGQPAALKSMLALHLVAQMGVPTLYLSADSDAATQISRLAAMTTGMSSKDIRTYLENPDHRAHIQDALTSSNVMFSFDSNPDAFDIRDELSAYVELYDTYPEIVVVDNLRNVYTGQETEHAGYKMIQQELITISRETGTCIITLHHMKESASRKSTEPAPRSAIDGMVAQLPGLILSIARDEDESRIVAVKDRESENSHPEAQEEHWVRLKADAGRARFEPKDALSTIADRMGQDARNGSPADESYYG